MIHRLMARVAVLFLASASFAAAPATQPPALEVRKLEIPNSVVAFKMVRVPSGSHTLVPRNDGDSPRTVQIKSIWVGQTEVTWDEYDQWRLCGDLKTEAERIHVIGETRPSKLYGAADCVWGHDGYPMICVTAHSAKEYCVWLSQKLARKFRLPTEAEWEYACNAGSPPKNVAPDALDQIAWHRGNSKDEQGDNITHPVASKQPNAWQIYDMIGNAAEWVGGDDQFIVKGGSYRDAGKLLTSQARRPYSPTWQLRDPQNPKSKWWLSDGHHCGFRIVMEE